MYLRVQDRVSDEDVISVALCGILMRTVGGIWQNFNQLLDISLISCELFQSAAGVAPPSILR